MKALIFNGALEQRSHSTSGRIAGYLKAELEALAVETTIFNLADSGIPLFDVTLSKIPNAVDLMSYVFREADLHIWLTPLYHGGMTGAMKNCLDWLECSAKLPDAYLTGKVVGLVCWADGVQAMQGISAMDAVAKALRAWTVPYSVPIQRQALYHTDGSISGHYQERFKMLLSLLLQGTKKLA